MLLKMKENGTRKFSWLFVLYFEMERYNITTDTI